MAFKLTMLAIGLVASNFIYQAVTGQSWDHAVERSFFQVVAIGLAYIAVG